MQFIKKTTHLLILLIFSVGLYACPQQGDGTGNTKSTADGQTEVVKDSGDSLSKASEMVMDAEKDAAKIVDDSADMVMDAKAHTSDIVEKKAEEAPEEEMEKKE